MAIEPLGSPTVVPPTADGSEPRTVPTNAGVFQAEIAADSVTQQVQQVQDSSAQPEAASGRQQANSETSQRSEPAQGAQDPAPTPEEGRGVNLNIEV
ncbi:MAG: hypothetical protein ACO3MW_14670 [Rhodospirillales bacterium]|jgi:hypothetical protein